LAEETGPQFVWVLYLAATAKEIRNYRSIAAYGTEAETWRPFYPPVETFIRQVFAQVEADAGHVMRTVKPDANFLDKLREADEAGNVIVVVVDPWTIQIPEYLLFAQAYDHCGFANDVLLVCWNSIDPETNGLRADLNRHFEEAAFRVRTLSSRPERFRTPIETIDELRTELLQALDLTRSRIMNEMRVREATGTAEFSRPSFIATRQQQLGTTIENRRAGQDEETFRQPKITGLTGGL
jgi:FxsC-like protein